MEEGKRYTLGQDAKLVRVEVVVNKDYIMEGTEIRCGEGTWPGPIGVFDSDNTLIGFAVLDADHQRFAAFSVLIGHDTSTRLDLENGVKYWADLDVEYRGWVYTPGTSKNLYLSTWNPTLVFVKSIHLTKEPIQGQDPIVVEGAPL